MGTHRIFLDTADADEIKDAVSTGLIDGIATNSQKIAQSGKSYQEVIEEIRRHFDGPIAVQSVGQTTEEILPPRQGVEPNGRSAGRQSDRE